MNIQALSSRDLKPPTRSHRPGYASVVLHSPLGRVSSDVQADVGVTCFQSPPLFFEVKIHD